MISRTVTIANGESLSNVIDKSNYKNMLIIMPSTWTAGDITFTVSGEFAGTFAKLVKGSDEAEVTIKANASEIIALDGAIKEAIEASPFVKIRSGTSAVPVNQGAERTIKVILS